MTLIFQRIALYGLLLSLSCFSYAEHAWKTVASGIEYQDLENLLTPWSHVHVFRIDLLKNKLEFGRARDYELQQGFVNELIDKEVKIAINGGFFDGKFNPLGLRIHQHKKLNPLKYISWWGVFYVKNGHAHVCRASEFSEDEDISFAIQSGPRLIVDGQIPPLKPGRDERTALGITEAGKVIIVVTENTPLTTADLAQLMLRSPINAVDALNLDGGSSTQLFTDLPELHLDLHGFSMVADAVVVKPR
jgi:uncharacterized protein YigE (DUF2233 family)